MELTGPAAAELGPYASDAEPPDADKLGCYDSAGGESAGEEGGLIRVHTTPTRKAWSERRERRRMLMAWGHRFSFGAGTVSMYAL